MSWVGHVGKVVQRDADWRHAVDILRGEQGTNVPGEAHTYFKAPPAVGALKSGP
jgi:hypothetical protein